MRREQGKVADGASEVVQAIPAACASDDAAVAFFERVRWGDQPGCPCCGSVDVYTMKDRSGEKRERNYRWRCRDCSERYTVRTGTVMEESRVPLRCWAYAYWAACASKKGVSAKQIQRQTGLSYKSALFLMHRIRYAMTPTTPPPKLDGTVEADETYVGGKPRQKGWRRSDLTKTRAKFTTKTRVVALVQRGGEVRAEVSQGVTGRNIREIVLANAETRSRLMTDEFKAYRKVGPAFASHEKVTHGKGEYVRGDVTTNTIESFFALLKRSMYGTYHAVSKEHLHRYVSEASFRWNHRQVDDGERTVAAIRGAEGKRLTYREPVKRAG